MLKIDKIVERIVIFGFTAVMSGLTGFAAMIMLALVTNVFISTFGFTAAMNGWGLAILITFTILIWSRFVIFIYNGSKGVWIDE